MEKSTLLVSISVYPATVSVEGGHSEANHKKRVCVTGKSNGGHDDQEKIILMTLLLSFFSIVAKGGTYSCEPDSEVKVSDYHFDVIPIKKGDKKEIGTDFYLVVNPNEEKQKMSIEAMGELGES